MGVSSYSKVNAAEQKDMVNSGAGGAAGFIWTPNWLLAPRDEGALREGRTRGAVGGAVPVFTTSRHKPFSGRKKY
jgi:hypothetical protein